ncbi:MAG: HAD hydrolase family protein [Sporomusaceae bacterium]|jgi:3-deoxy-D-manno-octulosonate 8-phosphate phosphatase (KDO 8-P phosphatase)|nr:HAD hydrolase family protein [Sporomusaceae bacterium]
MDKEVKNIAAKIKMVVLDVDGVLTDGTIIFGQDGEIMKKFNAKDGLGISLLHQLEIKTAIITGRESRIVLLRGEELKIGDIYQGAKDKLTIVKELAAKHGISLAEMAFIGDDLNDLPALSVVGLPCAVGDAVPEVKTVAKFVAKNFGGRGAVREIIEFILKAQRKWETLTALYLRQKEDIIQ